MTTEPTNSHTLRQQILIRFWPLASLVLIAFVLVSFIISKDTFTGWFHLINLITLSILIPLCLKTKKILLASNLLCGIGMLTIITFLFTGGPANTGFWWSIVYVVGAFLVTSKRWAIFWLTLYAVLSFTIVIFSIWGTFRIAYSIPELLHLLFVYLITFGFVYYFNQVREYYLTLANKREEELIRLNKELSSTNKELEEFAYAASHDLQEPLQTITNFTGLFDKTYSEKLDTNGQQYLRFILTASARMKALIKDLLELSRVGRNRTLSIVDCNRLLKELLIEMQTPIVSGRASVTFSILPVLQANETELKQLFQNLISNALKFCKPDIPSEVRIEAEEKEKEFLFSVKDNGIGIKEEYKNRVFIMFQRLHTADEYPGTGIGLATCKKIITAHDGKIWLESVPGEGSTFYFTLPKEKQELNEL